MLRLVIFLALLAAVVYAVFWLIDRRNKGKGDGGPKPLKPGPVGPDDDEEFLRQLERRSRHAREREAKKRPDSGSKDPGTPPGPAKDGPSGVAPGQASDPTVPPGPNGGAPGTPTGGAPDPVPPAEDEAPRDGSRRGSARGSDLEEPGSDEDA